MIRRVVLGFLYSCFLIGCTQQEEPAREAAPPRTATQVEQVDLDSFFVKVEGTGTLVLLDAGTGRMRIHNPERARTRFIPASTFKIPNSLIALDSGVAGGADFTLAFDSTRTPPEAWWPRSWKQDQTLRSAFQNSVYWFYQEVARRVGAERMQAYVEQFGYGNEAITPSLDSFWLRGDLRISPEEQVAFLRRFYDEELGISSGATAVVKDIMVLEETPAYRLSGKTGTADVTPTRELGWLAGYVEVGGAVHFYALNMEGERVWEEWPPQRRIELVRSILKALAMLPTTET